MSVTALKTASTSHLSKGYLLASLSAAILSTTGILIRYLSDEFHLPPLLLAFWRDALLGIGLILIFYLFRRALLRVERKHFGFLASYGFLCFIFNSLWTISVVLNGAGIATVLAYSSAGFTAILDRLLFRERLDAVKIFAVISSLTGCVLVSGAYDLSSWDLNPLGIATGIITGLAFASYTLMGSAALKRNLNPWSVLLYSFGSAGVIFFFFNLGMGDGFYNLSSRQFFFLGDSLLAWGVIIFLALGPTAGGFGLYTISMRYLPASIVNLIATLEPPLTALQAYIFLGERFSLIEVIGSFSILLGVIILRLNERRPN